jgi:hypothetical protein
MRALALVPLLLATAAPAKQLVVCTKYPVPGREHTLNPNAPPALQRQELLKFCETVTVPDPPAWQNTLNPITDFRHDPRAFT